MRLGTKVDLLQCLENLVPHNNNASSQEKAHMIIIDDAALVSILKPAMSETFNDNASMFMEHIRRQFVSSVCRVDIVFDVYRPDCLKLARVLARE